MTITIITGCMFSGKTTELQRRVRLARIAGKHVLVFSHRLDHRGNWLQRLLFAFLPRLRRIVSHDGAKLMTKSIESASEILNLITSSVDMVAIDEAQFFGDDIIKVCEHLANVGIFVSAAGLDTDFRGEPFGSMPELLALAEDVIKLKAICVRCGQEASRTQRLIEGRPAPYDAPLILVGSEEYEARCRKCHQC